MVSTGIPGIVFGISTFILSIFFGLQGVPVSNKYQMRSDVNIFNGFLHLLMGTHLFYHLLLANQIFSVFWANFTFLINLIISRSHHVPNELETGLQCH